MADGSRTQHSFNFPPPQLSALRHGEIIVDLFAGGGGASEALKQALGRDPDLAYNHDEWAIGMHAANHPLTDHHREDIWHADPVRDVAGRPVGWFHASPDCTHFSQAKGGQPRSRATRSLSWVVLKWAGALAKAGNAPRIISLENVEQILKWGPLIAKRDKATGRVLKLDGTVAAKGERVSVWEQSLIPDKRHAGRTWGQFVSALRNLGYNVEWRKLIASDFGAGTSRKRLFLVARRDTDAIPWPAPTHGTAPGLLPMVTAADCIDFSVPCPSIFTRKKPLADATLRRIAKGVKRYVLDAAEPFIVKFSQTGGNGSYCMPATAPLSTVVSKAEHCLVVPTLVQAAHGEGKPGGVKRWGEGCRPVDGAIGTVTASGGHALASATLVQTGYGEREGQAPRSLDIAEPLGTIVGGGIKHAVAAVQIAKLKGDSIGTAANAPVPTITSGAGAVRPAGAAHSLGVVTAFLEQANGGYYDGAGNDVRRPSPTICGTGSQQRLVTAHLTAMAQNSGAVDPAEPLPTILAGATRYGVVECTLNQQRCAGCGTCGPAPGCGDLCRACWDRIEDCDRHSLSSEHEVAALRVAAFLINYYGNGTALDLREPIDTITTRDRLALVTVTIQGTPYVIVDIGLRMLRREELFRAQGFPADYIIDRTADGRPLSISRSVRMVGNSVSPPPLLAIARANLDPVEVPERLAA